MQTWIDSNMPKQEIQKLDFMVGEFTSWQTLFPTTGAAPVQYRSVVRAEREGCDRFLRLEQFSDVPGIGFVSTTALYGYNRRENVYECYGFSSAHEEPLRLRGHWQEGHLVLVSEPVSGYSGLDRIRQTLSPKGEERWDFLEERWNLSGFAKHVVGTYLACPV
jgi:hypothetical protein